MRRVTFWRRSSRGVANRYKLLARMVALATVAGAFWASPITQGDSTSAQAKTPGKTYCFNRICHRVKTLAQTRREIGMNRIVSASHYDDCRRDRFNPCGLTSSGERFRANVPDNAASPVYPDGTKLLVWNPNNGRTLVIRINNAGPYYSRRLLDLSRAAAVKLGFAHRGVARLHVRVLSAPSRREARYRRNRRYAPVPGYVGKFQSVKAALWRVSRRHGGWAGNPASTMARLAIDEEKSSPGWLTSREMSKTAWRLRRLERKDPSRFARQASNDIPLPNTKAGAEAELQVMRFASLEFGVDHAGKTHQPAIASRPVLLAALPERRPVHAKPQSRKIAALAQKRAKSIKRSKRIAQKSTKGKKSGRRIQLAQLKLKKASSKRLARKAQSGKQLAKKQQAQKRKRLPINKGKTNRKKLVRLASLAKRKSANRKIPVRSRKQAVGGAQARANKPITQANSKTSQVAKPSKPAASQKVSTGKAKLPTQVKKTARPAQRVARSGWRSGILRGDLD